ncbi:hypothetical protein [Ruminiclostridium cellobioparum]|uniref:hypothetical protein n=1 Tax=Ruminiclostridium cellobioparum TaxID=29355 RepID=UPI0028A8EDDD|nr:hypothetical protein [Ruminiclostridium cellobioparum]
MKLLLGVTGALAGVIVLNILTGGAITAALPIILEVIVNVMNAASIIEAITGAAKNIATYLSQGGQETSELRLRHLQQHWQ